MLSPFGVIGILFLTTSHYVNSLHKGFRLAPRGPLHMAKPGSKAYRILLFLTLCLFHLHLPSLEVTCTSHMNPL